METKKSIVRTAIYQKSFNGQYGETHVFEIVFDNNDKGQYLSKSKDQTTFVTGKEVEYTIEQKQNGQYTNYYVRPIKQNGFVPGKGNPSYEHKRTALRCATDLVVAGKIELSKISTYADSFMKFLNAD